MLRAPMVSATQQTSRIRARKAKKNGAGSRRENKKSGTPAFPVHLEGYDPKAADAKPAPKAAEVKPAAKKAKGPKQPKAAKAKPAK
jgi:hypothetical protein